MSNIHEIFLPQKVIVGEGAIFTLPNVLKSLARKNKLKIGLVTGETTYKVGGVLVEELVNEIGEISVWKIRDSTLETANKVADEIQDKKIEVVLGVGGGKSIDIAKYSGHRANIPAISIPLAPSHDGIASPFSSLKGTDKPYSMRTTVPYAIIADTEIISKSPRRLILSGLGDLLGKLVSVRDWALAHRLKGEYYGEYAAQLALLSAKHVLKYHEVIATGSVEGVRILVEALISSGVSMCIAGSSRPASGSEHLFAHALEMLAPGRVLHGEAVAVGTIIMLYIYGDPLWKKVKRIMKKIGLPTTAEELGLQGDILVRALSIAHAVRPERYTILGEKGLSEDAARMVLKETGIIR
ncbi:MAG: NAD(P)-dependent glycerol-1-phosphate dehydrogenase [Desulfurococcaceae archaeon]